MISVWKVFTWTFNNEFLFTVLTIIFIFIIKLNYFSAKFKRTYTFVRTANLQKNNTIE